jgi:two-component sensor histidine kinase
VLKVTLVLEELVTNTIEHGFGGDSDAPIRIALTSSDPARCRSTSRTPRRPSIRSRTPHASRQLSASR